MSNRPAKPAGMSWISAYLTVRDSDASLDFYQRAFGFEKKLAMPGPDGKTKHAEMTYRDGVIMFGPEGNCPTRTPASSGIDSPIGLYIYCNDVDAAFARATAAGAQAVSPPTDMFYGDRICSLRDPDGYVWHFATNVADFDPSKAPK